MRQVPCRDVHGNFEQVDVSRLRWRPSIYGIIVKDDKILLSRQRDGFALPGGGIDLGESLEDALLREIWEETGVTATVGPLLSNITNYFKLPLTTGEPYVQSIIMIYRCDYVSGELSDAHLDDYERSVGGMPEWVDVSSLETITLATSFDWRPCVRQASAA